MWSSGRRAVGSRSSEPGVKKTRRVVLLKGISAGLVLYALYLSIRSHRAVLYLPRVIEVVPGDAADEIARLPHDAAARSLRR